MYVIQTNNPVMEASTLIKKKKYIGNMLFRLNVKN